MARKKQTLRWSDPVTDRYHAESRAEVAKLANAGRGREALMDNSRLMGADHSKPAFRLISIRGVRFG